MTAEVREHILPPDDVTGFKGLTEWYAIIEFDDELCGDCWVGSLREVKSLADVDLARQLRIQEIGTKAIAEGTVR